jgi:hypothetical protein
LFSFRRLLLIVRINCIQKNYVKFSFGAFRGAFVRIASYMFGKRRFGFTSNIEPSDGAAKTLPVMNSDDIVPTSRTGPTGELGSTLRSTVSGKFDGKSHLVASGDIVLISDLRVPVT